MMIVSNFTGRSTWGGSPCINAVWRYASVLLSFEELLEPKASKYDTNWRQSIVNCPPTKFLILQSLWNPGLKLFSKKQQKSYQAKERIIGASRDDNPAILKNSQFSSLIRLIKGFPATGIRVLDVRLFIHLPVQCVLFKMRLNFKATFYAPRATLVETSICPLNESSWQASAADPSLILLEL